MGRYPKIAMLDPFREGVWALRRHEMVLGHVATVVEPVWMPFRRTERVWLLVTWLDGVTERIEEDYEPWTFVTELLNGQFEWEGMGGNSPRLGHYRAHPLVDPERTALWQVGPPLPMLSGPLLSWLNGDGTCSGPRRSVPAVTGDPGRGRDDAGRPRQGRPRDVLGRPLPYGTAGVEPVPEEALPPVETVNLARRLVQGGQPFAAHEVLEARWKAGPAEERDLWQGLAQVCVGLTHAARGNSIGAARLLERGAARVEEYEAGHGPAYGLDLTAVIACAREHAAAEH